jgi:hypothetical protein
MKPLTPTSSHTTTKETNHRQEQELRVAGLGYWEKCKCVVGSEQMSKGEKSLSCGLPCSCCQPADSIIK